MRSIEFQKFIDLVTFDQSLVKTERDIKKHQEVEHSLLIDIQRLQAELVQLKADKTQARKAVDEKELYMKIVDDKESALKHKLTSVHNHKEAKSLEKESAALQEERAEHEQALIALWNKSELLDKNYEIKSAEQDTLIGKLTSEIGQVKSETKQLVDQLAELLRQREDRQKNIPQDWLDIYVNMKGKVSDPVVAVVNDACDACFYSVTPKDLQVLRQNKLLQCKDCYRLLYVA